MPLLSLSAEEDAISIDFNDVDIRVVLKLMSDISGKNFIIDNEVKGQVTIVAPKRISPADAYTLLASVLSVNGFSVVDIDESNSRVVPINKMHAITPKTSIGKEIEARLLQYTVVTQVVALEYAEVHHVENSIKPLLSDIGKIAVYQPSNTLVITEKVDRLRNIMNVVRSLDTLQQNRSRTIHYYKARHGNVEHIARVVNTLFERQRQLFTRGETPLTENVPFLVPYPEGNALVIHVMPEQYSQIIEIIESLDAPIQQIFVEVLVTEMSLERSLAFGIDFLNAGSVVFGTEAGYNGVKSKGIIPGILSGGDLGETAVGVVEKVQMKGDIVIPKIGTLVTASKKYNDINILSMPHLLTSDNQEAEIFVGENRAFLKNSQTTPEGSMIRTFEFRNIGLHLKIVPHICEDRTIKMEILQDVEDIIGVSVEGAIQTSKREARTSVLALDQQMIVIGGLVSTAVRKDTHKVPLLGDLPGIGLLFQKKKDVKEKKNLLIFITPHIVAHPSQMNHFCQQPLAKSG